MLDGQIQKRYDPSLHLLLIEVLDAEQCQVDNIQYLRLAHKHLLIVYKHTLFHRKVIFHDVRVDTAHILYSLLHVFEEERGDVL